MSLYNKENKSLNTPEEIRKKLNLQNDKDKSVLEYNNNNNNNFQKSNNPFLKGNNYNSISSSTKKQIDKKEQSIENNNLIKTKQIIKDAPIPNIRVKNNNNNFSVNLVPEDSPFGELKKNFPDKLKKLVLFKILFIFITASFFGIFEWLSIKNYTQAQNILKDISLVEAEIYQYKTQSSEVVKLRHRYDTIKILLEDHIYWTKFFTLLEKNTVQDVYYTGFSVKSDKGAKITLNARARNIKALATQLMLLQNSKDFVTEAKINGFSILSNSDKKGIFNSSSNNQEDEVVSFDITMTLNNDVFTFLKKKT